MHGLDRRRSGHGPLLDRYRPSFHPELEPLWREKPPRLFRAFGRALISQGHPAQALEVVCRALEKAASQTEPPWHPGDTELLYLRAFALARGGNIIRAEAYAKELLENHGKDMHEFTAPEFLAAIEVKNSDVLEPGLPEILLHPTERKDLYFVARQSGHYPLRCADHDWDGMVGEIDVQ